jgi:hypothetical protein
MYYARLYSSELTLPLLLTVYQLKIVTLLGRTSSVFEKFSKKNRISTHIQIDSSKTGMMHGK